jgi:hypothetical protein
MDHVEAGSDKADPVGTVHNTLKPLNGHVFETLADMAGVVNTGSTAGPEVRFPALDLTGRD